MSGTHPPRRGFAETRERPKDYRVAHGEPDPAGEDLQQNRTRGRHPPDRHLEGRRAPYDRDNDNGDRHSVDITVKNVGATVTGYDVWMTWLTTNKIGDAPVRAGS